MTPAHDSLRRLAAVVFVTATCAYLVALCLPATRTLAVCDASAYGVVRCPVQLTGLDMLTRPLGPARWTWVEAGLWSLNLVPVAVAVLWRRPRYAWLLAPGLVAAIGFWVWGSHPSPPADASRTWRVWVLQAGYFVWLASIVGFTVAMGLRGSAHVVAERIWARFRPHPADLEVSAASVAHLSPSLQTAVSDAATLRELLGSSPRDGRVRQQIWQWMMGIRGLPDADAAELERLRIRRDELEAAVAPLWDAQTEAGPDQLRRVIEAFDAFVATARTGGRGLAYR